MGQNSWNGYERNCLFSNVGQDRFVELGRPTGADGIKDGRGVGVADLNGDGRLDLVINNNNERPTIYLNGLEGIGNWIQLRLTGVSGNRDAVGARVRLSTAEKTMTRQVEAGSGYASQSPMTLHFGLGSATTIEALEIQWPGGQHQRLQGEELRDLLILNSTVHLQEEGARLEADGSRR